MNRLENARKAVGFSIKVILFLSAVVLALDYLVSEWLEETLLSFDTWGRVSIPLRVLFWSLVNGWFLVEVQVSLIVLVGTWFYIRSSERYQRVGRGVEKYQLVVMIFSTLLAVVLFLYDMPIERFITYYSGSWLWGLFWYERVFWLLVIASWVGYFGGNKISRLWGERSKPQAILLYVSTLLIEAFITSIRWVMVYIALLLPVFFVVVYWQVENGIDGSIKMFEDTATISRNIALIFVPINLVVSLLVLVGVNIPQDRVKLSFDSREPVSEERAYIINFYRRLDEEEQVFVSWNVIESAGVFAFTYGRAIFISRGAFTDSVFNALVAHELGHLKRGSGVMLQALHSFTYPFFNHLLFNPSSIQRGVIDLSEQRQNPNFLLSGLVANLTTTLFTIIFGGWGVQLLARLWSKHFIEEDYKADEYAVTLGFGYELSAYLENYKDLDTNLPLFNRWRGYTRVRLEKIQELIQAKILE